MTNMRIGCGYDIHKLVNNRKLVLGGLQIDYEKGLLGHSDADVLVHSIIDALLGASGNQNIGVLFPDSDEKYKDANSMILLKETYSILCKLGYSIVNIDAVVVAETPKLNPYIDQMRKNIADVLNINVDQINIKPKTNEGQNSTGNGDSIISFATCLIEKL